MHSSGNIFSLVEKIISRDNSEESYKMITYEVFWIAGYQIENLLKQQTAVARFQA